MDLDQLQATAARLIRQHGLDGWTFALSSTRRRLGVCKYRLKRIEVAEFYARNNPEESVLDTLLHEVAHALAGPSAKHGPKWKAVAVRLGATPRSCESTGRVVVEPGDWQATCPGCSKTIHFYRTPRSLTGYRCKCPARSPLVFEYKGDPSRAPVVPATSQESARWQATCPGCGMIHLRHRRPAAGRWRCRCPRQGELTWQPRLAGS